jgi:hypothetical protein
MKLTRLGFLITAMIFAFFVVSCTTTSHQKFQNRHPKKCNCPSWSQNPVRPAPLMQLTTSV